MHRTTINVYPVEKTGFATPHRTLPEQRTSTEDTFDVHQFLLIIRHSFDRYPHPVRRIVILAVLAAAVAIAAIARSDPAPELLHAESVPDDLRTLADETWDDFLAAHPARLDCITPVTLEAAWELDDRAEYRPDTSTLAVRVPGTPATLRSELIHEFAHHLEFTCAAQTGLRAEFLRAQGFPPEAAWFEGDTWETTPSEQYAEATVEMIEGRRTHLGGILLTADAIEVVREWGLGS
jgi:hypothetical protein